MFSRMQVRPITALRSIDSLYRILYRGCCAHEAFASEFSDARDPRKRGERKMPRMRGLHPAAADKLEDERLRVPWTEQTGLKGNVRSLTVFLPRLLIKEDGKEEPVCTNLDEELLRDTLVRHSGGCTVSQNSIQGVGRRGKKLETNVHHTLTVLASLWRGTWRYFRALRKELEECSGEEQILILHQDAGIV